jgi:hypothetical protein
MRRQRCGGPSYIWTVGLFAMGTLKGRAQDEAD